jgi:hypothetical protein
MQEDPGSQSDRVSSPSSATLLPTAGKLVDTKALSWAVPLEIRKPGSAVETCLPSHRWAVFPVTGCGIGLVNAWDVFWRHPITGAEIQREIEHEDKQG